MPTDANRRTRTSGVPASTSQASGVQSRRSAARPLLPRGLTSNVSLPYDEAVLACMKGPAVLLRTTTRLSIPWVIVTGSATRWAVLFDSATSGAGSRWGSDGRRLARATAPSVRANLLRSRREMLALQVGGLSWRTDPLVGAFGQVPSGGSVETAMACLWSLLQRGEGVSPEAVAMMLNLRLEPRSAARLSVREDGLLGCEGFEVLYTEGRARTRSGTSASSSGRGSASASRAGSSRSSARRRAR